jgi:hypothetical protein
MFLNIIKQNHIQWDCFTSSYAPTHILDPGYPFFASEGRGYPQNGFHFIRRRPEPTSLHEDDSYPVLKYFDSITRTIDQFPKSVIYTVEKPCYAEKLRYYLIDPKWLWFADCMCEILMYGTWSLGDWCLHHVVKMVREGFAMCCGNYLLFTSTSRDRVASFTPKEVLARFSLSPLLNRELHYIIAKELISRNNEDSDIENGPKRVIML